MKSLKFLTILLTLALVITVPVVAQVSQPTDLQSDVGQTIISGNNALTVKLMRDVQDPGSKNITYRFLITSAIDSDRAEIEWSLLGVSQSPTTRKKNITLTANQTITETFLVTPRDYGRTEVRVQVISYAAGETYVAAARDQIITNQDLEIVPLSSEYQNAKNFYMVKTYGLIIGGLILLGLAIRFGVIKFKQWLSKEQTGKSWI